jgi:O-antigen ligase
VIAAIALWRGTGLILFVLFITYSIGAISYGGVVFLSTIVRWGCLALLTIGFFKAFHPPRASMLLFVFYALLGFLFVSRSPILFWSAQRAVLLLMVVITVSIAVSGYITSPEKVATLFKMGIVAAAVWMITSMIFVQEFVRSTQLRFSIGAGGGGSVAYGGAFFAPMVVWGIVQRRYRFWRIFSTLLIVPFVFVLLLGGVRTAIIGMLVIGSFPLLFLRGKPLRSVVMLFVMGSLVMLSIYALFIVLPDRAEFLTRRLLSIYTTGRFAVWLRALQWCIDRALFLGHGTGSSAIAQLEFGLLFHNAYLEIWYNAGLLGLLAVLLFLAIYNIKSFHLIAKSRTEEMTDFSRVAFGYMIGITAIGMFEGAFAGAGGIAVCMLMIVTAMIDRLSQMTEEEIHYAQYEAVELNEPVWDEYSEHLVPY